MRYAAEVIFILWPMLRGATGTQALDLGRGLDLMEARGDCPGAIRLFEKAAQGSDRAVAARALLYEGECRERIGQSGAWRTYRRVLQEFPGQTDVLLVAASRLTKLGHKAELRLAQQGVSLRLVRTIPVGVQPMVMVLTRDGSELYVANRLSSTVSVLATATNRVTHTLQVGKNPQSLALTADSSRIYVGNSDGTINVIETRTKTIRSLSVGGPVYQLAIMPDDSAIYLAMCWAGLRKLDVRTGIVRIVNAQPCPWGVGITRDGKDLYVNYQSGGLRAPRGHDAIGRFDAGTGHLLNTILGLPNVGGPIAISPNGERIWAHASDACSSRVYDHVGCPTVPATVVNVIDARTQKLIRSVSRGEIGGQISFSQDGRWVAWSAGRLLLFDAETLDMVGSMAGYDVAGFVFRGRVSEGYASLASRNSLAVIKVSGIE